MKNFRLGHLTRNNLKSMKAFFAFMQEGLPLKISNVYVFNTFPSFNLVMKLISPFLKAELRKKVNSLSIFLLVEKKFDTKNLFQIISPDFIDSQ